MISSMIDAISKVKLHAFRLTAGVIILEISTIVVLVKIIMKPLKRLATATGEIARGNFEHPVEAKSKDEIGKLAGAL